MSEPSAAREIPAFIIDYDGAWIEVDLEADVDAWAAEEIRLRVQASGERLRRRQLQSRAELLAAAVRLSTRVPDSMALFLLSPLADGRVIAVVRMIAVELEPGDDSDPEGTGRRIVAPDGLQLVEPVEVTLIETPAGTATRGRARITSGPDSNVTELLTYAWVVPGYRFAAAFTTAFVDLLVAGQWRPAVDGLAAGVALAPVE